MAYVPDYVRPVGPKTLMPVPAFPTSNDQNHRKLSTSSSGSKTTPSSFTKAGRSQSDAQITDDRITARRTASNPPHAPNRSGKTAQDKICSRLSIKDRLKSLESEASVKLEVRPIIQRTKRRSLSRGSTRSRLSNSEKEHQSEDASSISSISSVRTTGDFTEKFPENILMPKPDIISSNQPRSISSSGISTPDKRLDDASVSSSDQVEILKESFQRLALALEKSSDNAIAEVKLPHVSEQIDLTKRPSRKKSIEGFNGRQNHGLDPKKDVIETSEDDEDFNKDNGCVAKEIIPELPVLPTPTIRSNACDLSSGSSTEVEEMADNDIHNNQETVMNDNNSKEKLKAANGSVFKPVWRTPSTKQQQHPNLLTRSIDTKESVDNAELEQPTSSNVEENEDATPTLERKQNLVVSTRDKPVIQEKEGSVSFKESSADDVNITTTTQSAPNTTAVVELRSPRHEHNAQGLRRPGARDKRNARVFIVPSSSDSDMDNANQQSRMERDFAKLGLSRDFMPRSPSKNSTDCAITQDSPKKHATEKFIPDLLKTSPKETRTEKKASNQSVDIYPELSNSSKSQRKELKPHDGELKKDSQKSPNRRRRPTRSGRAGSSRSKSTDSRKTSKDVSRHRSNSMCDPKRMRSGQETVANAVIYGTGAAIPYIDDVSSPTDEIPTNAEKSVSEKSPVHENNRGSIHRSNSADMLSSLANDVTTTKFRRQRASSVDRSASKAYNRRSYQIAMNLEGDSVRLQNMDNVNFLLDPGNTGKVARSPNAVASAKRCGVLHFKVATIDKGKRTSSQKSWKQVWAMLRDHNLCLSKDWGKSKSQDSPLERQQSLQEEYQVFNIQSSLVGIAYNYLKRRNVFKVTTCNGSEYLFQAESRNDMLAWITAIQTQSATWDDGTEGINEDLILKKTNQIDPGPKADKRNARKRSPKPSHKNNLQVKDVDGSRRFKWRGSVNKIVKKFGTGQPFALNSTFGVHLEDCPSSPTNEYVPFILEICCRIVEERGLDFTGIYRVPGNSAALTALQEDLNNHGVDSIRLDDERFKDLNVMSSLLKSFFRKLPEPLFTNELYHDFIKANRQATAQNRLNSLRKLVHMLPGPHYETLKFLITHLRLVADHCDANKMEVRNLAIVFGPTLVRNTAADNTATMVTDMSDQCRIIESIIDHSEWFFCDNMDAAPNLSNVTLSPDREHEAVPSIEFLLENVGRKPGDAGTSDSAKSKGSDDSENSFSRDLMEMIFGKKWKQTGNPQTAVVEDDGGFGEYHSRRLDENPLRKQPHEKPSSIVNTATDSPRTSEGHGSLPQQATIPNVSERLMDFYREQVERLSQTTIGQTLPAFSSADSSPRTTPRHSTVFNSPLVFPPQGDSRSRVNSDSQDPRHNIAAGYEIQPTANTHQFMTDGSRSVNVPYYKHPPNPYHYTQQLYQTNQYQNYSPNYYAHSNEPYSSNTPKMPPKVQVKSHSHEDGINSIPKPKPRKLSTGSYKTEEYVRQCPQIEPKVALREVAVDVSANENSPPVSQNERLVGELPHMAAPTAKGPSVSRKSSQSGNTSQPVPKGKGHYKKSSITGFDSLVNQPQHKRIKAPLTENLNVTQTPTTATSERLFSRYDPKRRGIRFGGTENDASVGSAPKKTQLTATERLFNGQQQQPLRRKPSAREHRRQRVTRRHTLSGIQDLQEHSPTLRFKSNLRRGTAGQNLSLHDLTSTTGNMQQSAMERLNPKGANSGMTMKNWIVQERLRNKPAIKKTNSVARTSMRRKDNEKGNKGVSYV